MKKRNKKLLSIMLIICMVLTMLPMPVNVNIAKDGTFDVGGMTVVEAVYGGDTSIGTLSIGGTTVVSDLTQDESGTGWEWIASTSTLELYNTYNYYNNKAHIKIYCQPSDNINLVYNGDVTLESSTDSALYCNGSLNVTGSTGYTLTLNYAGGGDHRSLEVMGSLEIAEGSLKAESNGTEASGIAAAVIYAEDGIKISGDAYVEAKATGAYAYGIYTNDDIEISTTGTVKANGTGEGYAIYNESADGALKISSGTVELSHDNLDKVFNGTLDYTGGCLIAKDEYDEYYYVKVDGGVGSGFYDWGETVTITADAPPTGKQFKEWKVVYAGAFGGINLANKYGKSTTFDMYSEGTIVKAVYEDILSTKPTVDINLSTLTASSEGEGWKFVDYSGGRKRVNILKPNQNYAFSGVGTDGVGIDVADGADNTTLIFKDGVLLNDNSDYSSTVNIAASDVTIQVEGKADLNGKKTAILFEKGGTISLADGAVLTANGGPGYMGIWSFDNLTIIGPGTVKSKGGDSDTGGGDGILINGNFTVKGSAVVNSMGGICNSTADRIWGGSGIRIQVGDILNIEAGSEVIATAGEIRGRGVESTGNLTIAGGGKLTAEGKGEFYALTAHGGGSGGTINITGCDVIAFNTDNPSNIYSGVLNHTGGALNGSLPSISYGITVGDTPVTSSNKDNITGAGISGNISYDPDSNTLTLNNAVIEYGNQDRRAIESNRDIKVVLIGNNILGKATKDQSEYDDYSIDYGITAYRENITVEGKGSLTIYDTASGISGKNVTIDMTGTITVIESGDIQGGACLDAYGGTLTINKGNLNLSSYYARCLYGDSIVINGGTITAQSIEGGGGFLEQYAFNTAPTFGSGYQHKVTAGSDPASVREIANPTGTTYTSNKYVRIEPKTSNGGDNNGGDNNGGSSGGGSSSGGSSSSIQTPAVNTTVTGSSATAEVKSSVDTNGNAKAAVTQAQLSDATAKALAAAAKLNEPAKVEIKVEAPASAKAVEVSIPQSSLGELAKGNIESLTINTPDISITFDSDALMTTYVLSAGEVSIKASKADVSQLSEETKAKIGDRPVFDISVTSGGKNISNFQGNVTISVPYTPKAGEDLESIIIYYINEKGEAVEVADSKYDPATGRVTFKTNHFSKYAVGYNKVEFKDVDKTAPYAKAVSFIAARGITGGTGEGKYNPEGTLKRAEFLAMLMRAYGISPDEKNYSSFKDAGDTWYTGYLSAAKRLGITQGVGENLFAPEKEITRQELYTMMYNSLKAIKRLPEADKEAAVSFDDSKEISSWAENAIELFTKAGILEGSGNLNPKEEATRAEMAQVMYRLLLK